MLHNLFINSASTYLVPTTCRHCGSDKKVRVDAVSIQTHLINYDKCVTQGTKLLLVTDIKRDIKYFDEI